MKTPLHHVADLLGAIALVLEDWSTDDTDLDELRTFQQLAKTLTETSMTLRNLAEFRRGQDAAYDRRKNAS